MQILKTPKQRGSLIAISVVSAQQVLVFTGLAIILERMSSK